MEEQGCMNHSLPVPREDQDPLRTMAAQAAKHT